MSDIQLKTAVTRIVELLKVGEPISNVKLIEICRASEIEFAGLHNETHLVHEILETAINLNINGTFEREDLIENETAKRTLESLMKIVGNCPPQSWRGNEQARLQQFSTPPTVAYLMAKLLKPSRNDLVIEPSAGTGSLAAWLKVSGCRLHTNELSKTRRSLLEIQGFAPTEVNAEFLDELLPEEIQPDGVLMNPPFSSSGGRTKSNDSNFGFRHINSALSRLKTGGKLVALVGIESGTRTVKARKFWDEIATEYELRAIIHLPKNAFYKYGTSVGTSIIGIIKEEMPKGAKRNGNKKDVLEADCKTLEECLKYAHILN